MPGNSAFWAIQQRQLVRLHHVSTGGGREDNRHFYAGWNAGTRVLSRALNWRLRGHIICDRTNESLGTIDSVDKGVGIR